MQHRHCKWNRLDHQNPVTQHFHDMALTAAKIMFCSGECGGAQLGGIQLALWMSLGEAGIGAAGVAVLPLTALHYAGNLQASYH